MTRGEKAKLKVILWTGSIAIVIVIGLIYFPREYEGLGFWEVFYSTLRLFVFERDLGAFPKSWPLIFIYFAAPAIALSALGTAIAYLFRLSPTIKTRWLQHHVLICGVDRTGKILAAALKARGIPVVGIDQSPPDDFEEWRAENKVPIIFGDFHSRILLEKAGAHRARAIIFASGDDLINLEGAVGAYDWLRTDKGPVKLIWTHIANEQLAETARSAVRTSGVVGIRFFDTYAIAAARMVAQHFNREVRKEIRQVKIMGFGKFGRDILEILLRDLVPEEDVSIQVIDMQDRKNAVQMLADDHGMANTVTFSQAAIQELKLVDETDTAFFVCTDDDLGNLTVAMQLATRVNCNHIYVRMSRWPLSAVAENLGEDRGVIFVNINELVTRGIEHLPGIFKPATEADLKRVKHLHSNK